MPFGTMFLFFLSIFFAFFSPVFRYVFAIFSSFVSIFFRFFSLIFGSFFRKIGVPPLIISILVTFFFIFFVDLIYFSRPRFFNFLNIFSRFFNTFLSFFFAPVCYFLAFVFAPGCYFMAGRFGCFQNLPRVVRGSGCQGRVFLGGFGLLFWESFGLLFGRLLARILGSRLGLFSS